MGSSGTRSWRARTSPTRAFQSNSGRERRRNCGAGEMIGGVLSGIIDAGLERGSYGRVTRTLGRQWNPRSRELIHSDLSAITGSILDARHAGKYPATSTAIAIVTMARAIEDGSSALIP